jgi:type II secretory pathway component PulL
MPRYHNINGQMVQFTADEETARDAEEQAWADGANDRAAVQVREERDAKLSACDWMANSDVTMTSGWATYRQALRDVPSQSGFPNTITWPTKP